jgi:dienelactone hydrolase
VVAAISMAGYINWESEVKTLHAIISRIADQHRVPPDSLAIGGFSAGATGALRYAQYCVERRCSATTRAAAAFSVDGPLDFERWYNCSARRAQWQPGDPEGWGVITKVLSKNLGGSPADKRAAYVRAAPLTASEPRGGNAALLKDTPVRAYSEPDVTWTVENWSADYYCQNSIDQAALVLELKMQGNKNAELIMTTGKGYRAEFVESTGTYRKGERSPHSWSIVDEQNLADWIERHMRGSR